jgi:hypothetical protein
MEQRIKFWAAGDGAACLLAAMFIFLHSEKAHAEGVYSAYFAGSPEAILTIHGSKFTTNYGFNRDHPTYYVDKFGEKISFSKKMDGTCATFGNQFSIMRFGGRRSDCSHWTFYKRRAASGIYDYKAFCSQKDKNCLPGFDKKPFLEYRLDKNGALISIKFDPSSRDAKGYILKYGTNFKLN